MVDKVELTEIDNRVAEAIAEAIAEKIAGLDKDSNRKLDLINANLKAIITALKGATNDHDVEHAVKGLGGRLGELVGLGKKSADHSKKAEAPKQGGHGTTHGGRGIHTIPGFKGLENDTLNLGRCFKGLLGSIDDLAGRLHNMDGSVRSLVSFIPFIGSSLGSLADIVDDNIKSYRTLAAQGEYFGGSIMGMRETAAAAGMSLKNFTDALANGSHGMKLLGSQGLATLNRSLVASMAPFGQFGMSVEETNTEMSSYLESLRKAGRLKEFNEKEMTNAIQDGIVATIRLTAEMGLTRKQIEDQKKLLENDKRTRLMMNSLDAASRKKMSTLLETMGPGGDMMKTLLGQGGVAKDAEQNMFKAEIGPQFVDQLSKMFSSGDFGGYDKMMEEWQKWAAANQLGPEARATTAKTANLTGNAAMQGRETGVSTRQGLVGINTGRGDAAVQAATHMDPVTKSLLNLSQAVEKLQAFFMKLTDSFLSGFRGFFGNTAEAATRMEGKFQQFGDWLTKMAEGLGQKLGQLFSGLTPEAITDTFTWVLDEVEEIGEGFSKLLKPVGDFITEFPEVAKWAGIAVAGLMLFGPALSSLSSLIIIGGAIFDGIKFAFNVLKGTITGLADGLLFIGRLLLKFAGPIAIVATAFEAVNLVIDNFTDVTKELTEKFGDNWNILDKFALAISKFFGWIAKWTIGWFTDTSGFADGLFNMFEKFGSWIGSLPNKLIDLMNSVLPSWAQLGHFGGGSGAAAAQRGAPPAPAADDSANRRRKHAEERRRHQEAAAQQQERDRKREEILKKLAELSINQDLANKAASGAALTPEEQAKINANPEIKKLIEALKANTLATNQNTPPPSTTNRTPTAPLSPEQIQDKMKEFEKAKHDKMDDLDRQSAVAALGLGMDADTMRAKQIAIEEERKKTQQKTFEDWLKEQGLSLPGAPAAPAAAGGATVPGATTPAPTPAAAAAAPAAPRDTPPGQPAAAAGAPAGVTVAVPQVAGTVTLETINTTLTDMLALQKIEKETRKEEFVTQLGVLDNLLINAVQSTTNLSLISDNLNANLEVMRNGQVTISAALAQVATALAGNRAAGR